MSRRCIKANTGDEYRDKLTELDLFRITATIELYVFRECKVTITPEYCESIHHKIVALVTTGIY
ncbi:hypothetical protein G9A89_004491 [Geosiphon pyriformis]|nr:hypothetical protein G9A89_004491 [Geosiphon pyriformis]